MPFKLRMFDNNNISKGAHSYHSQLWMVHYTHIHFL